MEKQTVNKKEVYNTYIMLNSTQRINVRLFSNYLGDRKIIFKKKKKKKRVRIFMDIMTSQKKNEIH